MEKTYNVANAIQAQKDYCKEYASNYPKRWTSAFMKEGKGFAPENGVCLRYHKPI